MFYVTSGSSQLSLRMSQAVVSGGADTDREGHWVSQDGCTGVSLRYIDEDSRQDLQSVHKHGTRRHKPRNIYPPQWYGGISILRVQRHVYPSHRWCEGYTRQSCQCCVRFKWIHTLRTIWRIDASVEIFRKYLYFSTHSSVAPVYTFSHTHQWHHWILLHTLASGTTTYFYTHSPVAPVNTFTHTRQWRHSILFHALASGAIPYFYTHSPMEPVYTFTHPLASGVTPYFSNY